MTIDDWPGAEQIGGEKDDSMVSQVPTELMYYPRRDHDLGKGKENINVFPLESRHDWGFDVSSAAKPKKESIRVTAFKSALGTDSVTDELRQNLGIDTALVTTSKTVQLHQNLGTKVKNLGGTKTALQANVDYLTDLFRHVKSHMQNHQLGDGTQVDLYKGTRKDIVGAIPLVWSMESVLEYKEVLGQAFHNSGFTDGVEFENPPVVADDVTDGDKPTNPPAAKLLSVTEPEAAALSILGCGASDVFELVCVIWLSPLS